MTTNPTAVAIRFYEEFSAGQIDNIIEQLGDGYVSHGFGGGGADNLRHSLTMMRIAFPDLSFTVEDTWLGDSGSMFMQLDATPAPAAR